MIPPPKKNCEIQKQVNVAKKKKKKKKEKNINNIVKHYSKIIEISKFSLNFFSIKRNIDSHSKETFKLHSITVLGT
jgi:hypothetical protein